MRDDFNKDLMREKVKRNTVLGFSINDIKRLLREEQLENSKNMITIIAHNVELQDQIDFMDQEYPPEGTQCQK